MEQDKTSKFLANNQELLNKLILDRATPPAPPFLSPNYEQVKMEPIQTRKPQWNKIRAEYEARKRNEYWQARIEEVEKADAKVEDSK